MISIVFTKEFIFKIEFCGQFNGNLDEECQIFRDDFDSKIQFTYYAPINTDTYCHSMDLIVTSPNLSTGWSTGATNTMSF